jgi:hypothetical protein
LKKGNQQMIELPLLAIEINGPWKKY